MKKEPRELLWHPPFPHASFTTRHPSSLTPATPPPSRQPPIHRTSSSWPKNLLAKELDHVSTLSLAMHQRIQSQGLLHVNRHAQVRRHGAAVLGGTTVAGAQCGTGRAHRCMEGEGRREKYGRVLGKVCRSYTGSPDWYTGQCVLSVEPLRTRDWHVAWEVSDSASLLDSPNGRSNPLLSLIFTFCPHPVSGGSCRWWWWRTPACGSAWDASRYTAPSAPAPPRPPRPRLAAAGEPFAETGRLLPS